MPRVSRRKDIVLLLPPLPNQNDRPGPSQAGPSSSPSTPMTLDALLLARKLAKKQGKAFDMESFMSPEMRAEWYARNHPHESDQPRSTSPSRDGVTPAKRPREEEPGTGDASTPVLVPAPIASDTPAVDTSNPSLADPLSTTPLDPHPPILPDISIETPSPLDSSASTPLSSTPGAPKRQKPNLIHMHWKRREKLLAQWEAENALIEAGVPIDPAHSVESLLSGLPGVTPIPSAGNPKKELTKGEKEGIMGSASYWNSLLINARKARGAQWDFNTQQHHVDQHSKDYYSHMDKPLRSELPKEEPPVDAVPSGGGMMRNGSGSHGGYPGATAGAGGVGVGVGVGVGGGVGQMPNGMVPGHGAHDKPRHSEPPRQNSIPNGLASHGQQAPRTAMPNPNASSSHHPSSQQGSNPQFAGFNDLAPAQMQALMAMQVQAQAQAQAQQSQRLSMGGGGSGGGTNPGQGGQGNANPGAMGGINPAMLLAQQQQRLSGSGQSGGGGQPNMQGINIQAMMAAAAQAQAQAQAQAGGGGGGNAALQQAMQGLSGMPGQGMQGMAQLQGINMAQLQASLQQQQAQQQAQGQGQGHFSMNGMQGGAPAWMRNGQGQGQGPMLNGGWGQK